MLLLGVMHMGHLPRLLQCSEAVKAVEMRPHQAMVMHPLHSCKELLQYSSTSPDIPEMCCTLMRGWQ